ncbi:MAG TPA: helix-turn-helix domain-containing protein [Candidatus Latescibacteria bacterium]|nr:helix-turn-helix domain-containing protein [Candidatus Latescibacterota bacterium]
MTRRLREQGPKVRIRLHALWLLRWGYHLAQTAEAIGVHIRTVQRWLCWYRQEGLQALQSHR